MDEKSAEIEKLEEKRYEYGERVTLARSTIKKKFKIISTTSRHLGINLPCCSLVTNECSFKNPYNDF